MMSLFRIPKSPLPGEREEGERRDREGKREREEGEGGERERAREREEI